MRDFYRSECGTYDCRDGPARERGEPLVNKKLCLVATDAELLRELLLELCQREDCWFVKLSVTPKDGMVLGRCFLSDEQALGKLWAELKQHPRLMCSLQDDDFTRPFREL